jgi:sortase (surface protein transpeptidase)
MPELLSFLITAILVLYIVRSLARIFLPMLFQSVVNKAQQQHQNQQYQQQHHQNNNYRQSRAETSVKVDYIPQGKKGSVPDSEGEFVDYEEIK